MFVPIEELANHFAVSTSTIRSWIKRGFIPQGAYIKVGKTYRFSVDKVSEALSKPVTEEPEEPTTQDTVNAVLGADSPFDLDDDM